MALGAHPNNARQTAQILWNYADEVWTLAGDRSLDYNHYTKRAIFLGIYASTELYLLTDLSENYT
jgi:ubiquinone biosynthesis protein COQ9